MNKYDKIITQIKLDIQNKRYKAGSKLPSIRELTTMFDCSKATAIKAYDELEKQHILYSKPQSGYYLVEIPKSLGNSIYKPEQNGEEIDLASASPDLEVLPYKDFQHCMNQAIDLYKDLLFSYSDPKGLPSVRKVLVDHFRDYQVFTNTDNVFITSGSQQILSILSVMPFPNGKKSVLVEQPVYNGITRSLELNGITTIGIDRSFDGIDMNELERIFRTNSIKFFYTVPRFQNPTGGSYTLEQKKEIVRLAQKYDVYILEDDYLADLDRNPKNDPMFSFDTENHTIYAKSFSKVLLPGLRLGAVVLPKLLVNTFREYKYAADLGTSILPQGALELYIKSGMFRTHTCKIKDFYYQRMQHLKKTIDAVNPSDITCIVPETGFFATMELPSYFNADDLVQQLKSRNILVRSERQQYIGSFLKENMLRVSICRADEEKITKGINTIYKEYQVLANMRKSNGIFSSGKDSIFII